MHEKKGEAKKKWEGNMQGPFLGEQNFCFLALSLSLSSKNSLLYSSSRCSNNKFLRS